MHYIFCGGENRFGELKPDCLCQYFDSTKSNVLPHTHDFHEIFLVTEGSPTHIVNQTEQSLKTGDLVFIRANDKHYFMKSKKKYTMLNFMFKADILDNLFAFWGNEKETNQLLSIPYPPIISLSNYAQEEYIHEFQKLTALNWEDKDKLNANYRMFLFYLFTHFFFNHRKEEKLPTWLNELLTQMNQYENFSLGTKRFFELSPKSPAQLNRVLKKYLNVSASYYICDLRLSHIAKKLITTKEYVLDIVLDSGFTNFGYAYKLFKKKYNCTPNQYRKRYSPT